VKRDARHVGGLGKRGFGRGECTVFVFHAEVAGHVRMQQRRPGRERGLRVDHGRKIAVFDRDTLGAVLGRGFALRDHERHWLAHEAHALVRQRMAMRQLEGTSALSLHEHDRRRRLERGLDHVGAGQDGEHTRNRQSRACVDRYDLCMSVVAAQEPTMRLSLEVPVGGVFAVPGHESKILTPACLGGACVHVITLCFANCALSGRAGCPAKRSLAVMDAHFGRIRASMTTY
jgi:hypothetical protein